MQEASTHVEYVESSRAMCINKSRELSCERLRAEMKPRDWIGKHVCVYW